MQCARNVDHSILPVSDRSLLLHNQTSPFDSALHFRFFKEPMRSVWITITSSNMSKDKDNKRKRKKSNCWLFYTKTEKGGACKLCQKEIISNGNTTNLLNHLKRKHTIQWESTVDIADRSEAVRTPCSVEYIEGFDSDDSDEEVIIKSINSICRKIFYPVFCTFLCSRFLIY